MGGGGRLESRCALVGVVEGVAERMEGVNDRCMGDAEADRTWPVELRARGDGVYAVRGGPVGDVAPGRGGGIEAVD